MYQPFEKPDEVMSHPNSKEIGHLRENKKRKREEKEDNITISLISKCLLLDEQHPLLRGTLTNNTNLFFGVKEATPYGDGRIAHDETRVYLLEDL